MITHIKNIITKSFVFSLIFFVIILILLIIYLIKQQNQYSDLIYPNVYINNISFSGINKEELFVSINNRNRIYSNLTINIKYNDQIATFSGEMIKMGNNPDNIWSQAYSIGRSTNIWTAAYQKLACFFNLDRFNLTFYPSYDLSDIESYLTNLSDTYSFAPENALFNLENNRVVAFKIDKPGERLLTEEAIDRLKDKLNNINSNQPSQEKIIINVLKEKVTPEVTLSTVNNFGIVEKIGEGISDYSGSIPNRIHNLILASNRFHGVLIKKDDTLSFNDILGEVSGSTGFLQAYIIQSGRTVLGDGGGVCQVSTTLFRAAVNSGLQIIERHAHAYRVHYYENDGQPGFDATVFAPGVDLKIKNDTPAYILIQTAVDKQKNLLTFTLYGKKDNRIIEVSPIKVWGILPPPEPLYQDDPTLPKGVTKQVDWAAPGTKTTFHYKVTVNGIVTQDTDFFSNFRPWRAIYLVGTM